MRPAYPTLGWFLVLTLFSLGACNSLFLIPACEYDPRLEFCQQPTGVDMGSEGNRDISERPTDMSRPTMGPPVSFQLVVTSPLTSAPLRKWVGVRSGGDILFANQMPGMPNAYLETYRLGPTVIQPSGWDLKLTACTSCPAYIQNVNLTTDLILTSNTMLFLAKSDFAYLLKSDGTISYPINAVDNKLSTNFRPFVSPNYNVFSFQKNISTSGDASQVNFYNSSETISVSCANRINKPITTYYAIGDLEGQGKNISDNEILVFEENKLRGAYRIDTSLTPILDLSLTDEINESIIDAHGNSPYPIRTGFIADLNHDGYMELVYAIHREVFAATYIPYAAVGSRFTNWPWSISAIPSIDHTVTSSAADLDGDGYPDLAIETSNPNMVYFYLNSKN